MRSKSQGVRNTRGSDAVDAFHLAAEPLEDRDERVASHSGSRAARSTAIFASSFVSVPSLT